MPSVEEYVAHCRRHGDARTVFETAVEQGMDARSVAALAHRLSELTPVEYRAGQARKRWPKFQLSSRERVAIAAAILINGRSERVAERVIRRELDLSSDELRAARRHPLAQLFRRGPLDVAELTPDEQSVLFGADPCSEGRATSRVREGASARTATAGDSGPKSAKKTRLAPPPVGTRFGALVVVGQTKHAGRTWMLARCDCGGVTRAQASHLRRGEVVSCGCWRATAAALREAPEVGVVVTEDQVHVHPEVVA